MNSILTLRFSAGIVTFTGEPVMETQKLPVKLTDKDLKMKGDELAKEVQKLADLKNAMKQSAEGFKSQRSKVELEIDRLKQLILSKTELRDVEVRENKNYKAKVVSTVRLDTREVIHTRPMKAHELQRPLPLDSHKAAKKQASA
jgi:hypothetical protein